MEKVIVMFIAYQNLWLRSIADQGLLQPRWEKVRVMFISLSSSEGSEDESRKDVIPLLCSIFLANQGAGDAAGEGNIVSWVSNLLNF